MCQRAPFTGRTKIASTRQKIDANRTEIEWTRMAWQAQRR